MMTAEELVEQVRNLLGDYGDVENTAVAELTALAVVGATELTVDDSSSFDTGDWLYCEWETMEVKEVVPPPTNTITVRRGMRGTTTAEHAIGRVVRSNMRFGPNIILSALNAALSGAYPMLVKIVEDTSITLDADTQLYDLANPVRDVRSIWVEANVGDADYQLCRVAVPITRDSFMLYGSWTTGLGVKVIAIDTFDRLEFDGSLDTDFPDDDEAYDYLVKDAAGRLLLNLAAAEAAVESAPVRGTQGQDNRYVLINAAKALRTDARESLRKARMQLPAKIAPRPDARYF